MSLRGIDWPFDVEPEHFFCFTGRQDGPGCPVAEIFVACEIQEFKWILNQLEAECLGYLKDEEELNKPTQ